MADWAAAPTKLGVITAAAEWAASPPPPFGRRSRGCVGSPPHTRRAEAAVTKMESPPPAPRGGRSRKKESSRPPTARGKSKRSRPGSPPHPTSGGMQSRRSGQLPPYVAAPRQPRKKRAPFPPPRRTGTAQATGNPPVSPFHSLPTPRCARADVHKSRAPPPPPRHGPPVATRRWRAHSPRTHGRVWALPPTDVSTAPGGGSTPHPLRCPPLVRQKQPRHLYPSSTPPRRRPQPSTKRQR